VRRAIAWVLLAAGVAGLVTGALAGAQLRRGMSFGVPLAAPTSLAIDADGRVYAGTAVDRIHVYGPDGRFVRGWLLEHGAGRVRLRVAASGDIEVATERSGRLHRFDRDGALVATRVEPEAFARFGPARDRAAAGPEGARYALEDGALVRTAPPPRTLLAPPVRAPLAWFARAPLPSLTIVLAASSAAILIGIVLAAGRRAPRRPDRAPSPPPAR